MSLTVTRLICISLSTSATLSAWTESSPVLVSCKSCWKRYSLSRPLSNGLLSSNYLAKSMWSGAYFLMSSSIRWLTSEKSLSPCGQNQFLVFPLLSPPSDSQPPSIMTAQCRCYTKCRTIHGWSNGQRGSSWQWKFLRCPCNQARFRVPSWVDNRALRCWRSDDGLLRQRCQASW